MRVVVVAHGHRQARAPRTASRHAPPPPPPHPPGPPGRGGGGRAPPRPPHAGAPSPRGVRGARPRSRSSTRADAGGIVTWAKTDDGLWRHYKARRAGVAAMGLWSLGQSWCADKHTDGAITRAAVLDLCDGDEAMLTDITGKLVCAGMWE